MKGVVSFFFYFGLWTSPRCLGVPGPIEVTRTWHLHKNIGSPVTKWTLVFCDRACNLGFEGTGPLMGPRIL